MNPLLQQALPYLFTIILIISAKFAETVLKNKKELGISEEKIKEIIEKFCSECVYKIHSSTTEVVEKQISSSTRILKDLHSKMKTDFLTKCSEFMPKNDILNSNVYALFENTFNSAIEKILDELENQFIKNNISNLTTLDIANRACQLWDIIVYIFDQYYKTNENPSRIDLYDMYEVQKDKYINIIERIYSEAKEIKNKD